MTTPLHFALMLNHEEFALLLLQNGASLKAMDQYKKAPVEEGLMRKEMTAFKKCFHILNFEIKRLNKS